MKVPFCITYRFCTAWIVGYLKEALSSFMLSHKTSYIGCAAKRNINERM